MDSRQIANESKSESGRRIKSSSNIRQPSLAVELPEKQLQRKVARCTELVAVQRYAVRAASVTERRTTEPLDSCCCAVDWQHREFHGGTKASAWLTLSDRPGGGSKLAQAPSTRSPTVSLPLGFCPSSVSTCSPPSTSSPAPPPPPLGVLLCEFPSFYSGQRNVNADVPYPFPNRNEERL